VSPSAGVRRTDGCVLCGSPDAHLVTDRQRFDVVRDVVRCDRCGLVYLHPLFTPEEQQRLYESEYREIEMVPGEVAPQLLCEIRRVPQEVERLCRSGPRAQLHRRLRLHRLRRFDLVGLEI